MGYVSVQIRRDWDDDFESLSLAIIYLKRSKSSSDGLDLGPTQPPIQWVPEVLTLGVKRPGREADHSPPSIAEVKE
jgi:hypothetical protein